jgi:hypothetical protein
MVNKVLQCKIYEKIDLKTFNIEIKLNPSGRLEGVFNVMVGAVRATYSLEDGIFLEAGDEVRLFFNVRWFQSSRAIASTYFSGALKKDGQYWMNWLLTYDNLIGDSKFLKSGTFTTTTRFVNSYDTPYPSENLNVLL